jgi:hypothetical protein
LSELVQLAELELYVQADQMQLFQPAALPCSNMTVYESTALCPKN